MASRLQSSGLQSASQASTCTSIWIVSGHAVCGTITQLRIYCGRRAAKSSRTASILGAIAALFCAGAAIGTVVQGYTGDWLGRRKALAIAGAISLLGTAVVAGSVNLPMLFVFRFISGLGRASSPTSLIARWDHSIASLDNNVLFSYADSKTA